MTVLHTAYWPSVQWLSRLWHHEQVAIEAWEHYQKGSIRNRCTIAGPNGPQLLSIPLEKGKHQQTPIREVRVDQTQHWARQHWRTIKTAYGNAPYFEHYAPRMERLYTKPPELLYDFNHTVLIFLLEALKWGGHISTTDAYCGPHQLAAPDMAFRPYAQVFQERFGFRENLSGLDLLMCCGPKGGAWL
jgi:WbqC-like protein family